MQLSSQLQTLVCLDKVIINITTSTWETLREKQQNTMKRY